KQIEEKYQRLADELSGILSAQITSAIELDDVNQQAIASSLEKQTGKQVAVNVKVDPELIGGLKAEIGGRLFDGSLKTQLKRIEESLTKG
ncbi:MAG: ATP synthase F1 subunit delta, partial [Deltaproteobacteria bacterium]|nr:ATP synthase F1 subunit delta [Deltaproteobacteria bacterium]